MKRLIKNDIEIRSYFDDGGSSLNVLGLSVAWLTVHGLAVHGLLHSWLDDCDVLASIVLLHSWSVLALSVCLVRVVDQPLWGTADATIAEEVLTHTRIFTAVAACRVMSVHFFGFAAPISPAAVELSVSSTDSTVVPPPAVTAKTLTHV